MNRRTCSWIALVVLATAHPGSPQGAIPASMHARCIPAISTAVDFQDGLNGYTGTRDTYIKSGSTGSNYGADPGRLEVEYAKTTALLKFDLSSVPTGTIVNSAVLTLHVNTIDSGAVNNTYEIYECKKPWVEGTGTVASPTSGVNATWNQYATGSAWGTAGATNTTSNPDRGNDLLGTFTIDGTTTAKAYAVTLTAAGVAAVQGWVNSPSTNYGFVINKTASPYYPIRITPRENSTQANRPKLTIDYSTGVVRYWRGTASSAWSDSNNWSATSGGATGVSVPGPGDHVHFDAGGNNPCTFDANVEVDKFQMSAGYTSTVTQGAFTLTVGGPGMILQQGTFAGSSSGAAITVAGPFTLTGANFASTSGTLSIGGDMSLLQPVTATFRDGTNGYSGTRDTWINKNATTTNYGSSGTVFVDGSPDQSGLIRWDVSSIPAGTAVTGASITLWITDDSNSQNYPAYEMKRNWTETGATWNTYDGSTSWGTAGATHSSDRGTTVLGTANQGTTGSYTLVLNAAGLAEVQDWVDHPATNYGIVFQEYTLSSSDMIFVSREGATQSQRPMLSVSYASSGSFAHHSGKVRFDGAGTQIVKSGNAVFNDVEVASGGTVRLSTNPWDVDGTLSVVSGILDTGGQNIAVAGNFANGGTFVHGSGTVTFDGTTVLSGSSTTAFYDVVISGTLTGHPVNFHVAHQWTNTGTYNHNSGTVTFNGTTTMSSPTTFWGVTITGTLTGPAGTLVVLGNWTCTGTYAPNSGTVALNGSSTQTVAGTTTFHRLTVNNPVTLTGNATVQRLLTVAAGLLRAENGAVLTLGTDSATDTHTVTTLEVSNATLSLAAGDTLSVSDTFEGDSSAVFATSGSSGTATISIASGGQATVKGFQASAAVGTSGKFVVQSGGRLIDFSEGTSVAWSLDLSATTAADRASIPYSLSNVNFTSGSMVCGWTTPSIWMLGGSKGTTSDPGGRLHWIFGAFRRIGPGGTIVSTGTSVTCTAAAFSTEDDDSGVFLAKLGTTGAVEETRRIVGVASSTQVTIESAFSTDAAGSPYAVVYDTLEIAMKRNAAAGAVLRMSPPAALNDSIDVDLHLGNFSYVLENLMFVPVQPNSGSRAALWDGDAGTAARCTLRNCVVARGGVDEVAAENCTIFPLSGGTSPGFANPGTAKNTITLGFATTPADANGNITVAEADAAATFVDRGSLDFHLKAGATNAIDAGIPLTLAIDFEGQARPNGSGWDVGADEYRAVNGGGISRLSIGAGPVTRLFYLGGKKRGTDTSTVGYAYGVSGNRLVVLDLDEPSEKDSLVLDGQIVYMTYWQNNVTLANGGETWVFCVIDTGGYGYGDAVQCVVDRANGAGLAHPTASVTDPDPTQRRFGNTPINGHYVWRPGAAGQYKMLYWSLMNVNPDGTDAAPGAPFNNSPGTNLTRWLRGFVAAYDATSSTGALFKVNADPYDASDDDNKTFGSTMWDLVNGEGGWRNFEWDAPPTFTWGETSPRLFVPCSGTNSPGQQIVVRFNRNTLSTTGAVDVFWQAREEAASADECIGVTTDQGGDNANLTAALRDGTVVYNRKRGAANTDGDIRWASKLPSVPVTPVQRIWGTHYALVGVEGGVHKIFDDIASDSNPKSGCLAATGAKVIPDHNPDNGIETDSSQLTGTKDPDWPLPCYGKPVGKIWVRQTKLYWVTDQGYLYGHYWDRWGTSLASGDEAAIPGFPIYLGSPARSMYVWTTKLIVGLDDGSVVEVVP